MSKQKFHSGFTLLEMLLVLAISSSLIMLIVNYTTQKTDELRRDKTAFQIQQIFNAAMSFYINNSAWPITCGTPTTTTWVSSATFSTMTNNFEPGYLPSNFSTNPYGQPYWINCTTQTTTSGGNFYVSTNVGSPTANPPTGKPSDALTIAGRLPMAYISTDPAAAATPPPVTQATGCNTAPFTGCTTVISSINIPGQNLNNARSINFSGLYYSGSCVPAPSCPPGMSPSIMVSTAAVAGDNDTPSCNGNDPLDASTCTSVNVYPISSFNVYARGDDTVGTPGDPNGSGTNSGTSAPYDCNPILSSATHQICWASDTVAAPGHDYAMSGTPAAKTKYWRVCLLVVTEKGQVDPQAINNRYTEQGKIMGQISAFTRCVPNLGNEQPPGSINVFQPYN